MNRLEEVLKLAATEPAHRPEFFSCCWNLMPGCQVKAPRNSLMPARPLICSTGKRGWQQHHSFFTSEEAMSEAVSGEQSWLRLPVRTLFEITRGETLFLNPKLPSGKEFTAAEITHLLAEEGSALSQQTVLEGGQSLLLSEVAEPLRR